MSITFWNSVDARDNESRMRALDQLTLDGLPGCTRLLHLATLCGALHRADHDAPLHDAQWQSVHDQQLHLQSLLEDNRIPRHLSNALRMYAECIIQQRLIERALPLVEALGMSGEAMAGEAMEAITVARQSAYILSYELFLCQRGIITNLE